MPPTEASLEQRTIAKVAWRLVPFLGLLYVVSFIDRVNMGFAALSMNQQLGLTPVMFGTAAGLFFASYFLFEVPSNLILYRVGARRWIARVMISWGLISSTTAFVTTVHQLYALRFLLGAAEAGFFPGIILYLGYWFPQRHRARVTAGFMAAIPVASFLGSPLSAALLRLHGVWGLAGWQWMFLLEGIPAVALGFVVLKFLTDNISEAQWLTPDERKWLAETIHIEAQRSHDRPHTTLQTLANPKIIGLGVVYFGLSAGLYGVELWLPLLLKNFGLPTMQIGLLAAVPYLVAIVGMLLWARHSDRLKERRWHVIIGTLLGCLGFIAAALLTHLLPALLCITVAVTGIMASRPPFWSLPAQLVAGRAAAGGIALINAIGNLGGFAGPYVIGWATEKSGSMRIGLLVIAGFLVLSCILTYVIAMPHSPKPEQNHA